MTQPSSDLGQNMKWRQWFLDWIFIGSKSWTGYKVEVIIGQYMKWRQPGLDKILKAAGFGQDMKWCQSFWDWILKGDRSWTGLEMTAIDLERNIKGRQVLDRI